MNLLYVSFILNTPDWHTVEYKELTDDHYTLDLYFVTGWEKFVK